MGSCLFHRIIMRERNCDHPHRCAHLETFAPQEERYVRRELPERNRSGCNHHHRRERHALSGRAACLLRPLCHPPPRPGHRRGHCRASLCAYSPPEENIDVGSIPPITQGIAPTLIFIRMFGLLNSRGGRTPSSRGASAPLTISTRVVFGDSTITSTSPGPPDATDMHKSVWKPSGGGPGSIFSSTEISNTV